MPSPSPTRRPNIVFVMTDDHAAHAISAYGSRVNTTPNIDRLATGGLRAENCFCTNSLCSPSRATILTGTHTHVNGVTTLFTRFDNTQNAFPQMLQESGYQTAMIGKWHLGHGPAHDPVGFDHWRVLLGQGPYHDPVLRGPDGEETVEGYTTDLLTDLAVDWMDGTDRDRPFCLMLHHKAPHRPWEPHPRHAERWKDREVPLPDTFFDDYSGRASAAAEATMRVGRDMDLEDLKEPVPEGLTEREQALWAYQRYMRDYLACVDAVDDSVGRVLDFLDEAGLAEDTLVVYTSDQGFFLGDHGWYDKRFMYEESLRMPFLVRYPREIPAGSTMGELVLNLDFAQTFLDYAGVEAHPRMQGHSLRPLFAGRTPEEWRDCVYYRYWEHLSFPHTVGAHYGIRTDRYKLIHYYGKAHGQLGAVDEDREPEWELFDLQDDASELHNRYHDPDYAGIVEELTARLWKVQQEAGDTP